MATETKTGDRLAGFLRKAVTGIEKLQVQLALGEAEAADKYEDVKKKFSRFVNDTRAQLGTGMRKQAVEMRGDLDELRVQLALGKAETKELFAEQKKKITRAMDKLERNIRTKYKETAFEEELLHEMEAMRIRLEILELNYALGKMDAKEEFEKRKHDLTAMIAKARAKVKASRKAASGKRQIRHAELREAYKHLKKAVVAPAK